MTFNLADHGVQVFRIYDAKQLEPIRQCIDASIASAEYFRSDAPCKTLGKFQALGDPVSMWHPRLLAARRSLHSSMLPHLRHHVETSSEFIQTQTRHPAKMCSVMDRLMIRPHGITIGGEAWHRDVGALKCLPKGGTIEFFGGFVNLSDDTQRFRFVPGSHRDIDGKLVDVRGIRDGFAKIPEHLHATCEEQAVNVEVPPGHHIIFYQHIIHTIIKNTNARIMHRLFHGFIICDDPTWSEYIFGGEAGLQLISTHQAVPQLPSGTTWPIFSKLHWGFKDKPFKIIQDTKIQPARKSDPLPLGGNLATMFTSSFMETFGIRMYMPSMLEMSQPNPKGMGVEMLPAVTDADIAIYRPACF